MRWRVDAARTPSGNDSPRSSRWPYLRISECGWTSRSARRSTPCAPTRATRCSRLCARSWPERVRRLQHRIDRKDAHEDGGLERRRKRVVCELRQDPLTGDEVEADDRYADQQQHTDANDERGRAERAETRDARRRRRDDEQCGTREDCAA